MFALKLADFIKDTAKLNDYVEGMSYLVRSGVLDLLRVQGQVRPMPIANPNLQTLLAAEAQRSAGFNEALDMLLYFRELFVHGDASKVSTVSPDFGGTSRALKLGDLTEEEVYELHSASRK